MGKIIFLIGGARSGKSALANTLAKKYSNVAFIATGQPNDREMRQRIEAHRKARPKSWAIFEEAKDIALLVDRIGNKFKCILIDCLTLFVSNLMLDGQTETEIVEHTHTLLATLRKKKATTIIVSNEVGLGIVPANPLGRKFRDTAGKINQLVAKEANEVLFMVSGLPLKLKGAR